MPEQNRSPADWLRDFSRYFSTTAPCPQSPGLTRETSPWPIRWIDFLILALQVNWVRAGFTGRIPFQALIWPSAYLNLTVIVGSAGWGSGLESNLSCSSNPPPPLHPTPSRGVLMKKACMQGAEPVWVSISVTEGKMLLSGVHSPELQIIWPIKQSWVQYSHPASGQRTAVKFSDQTPSLSVKR